jgi:hypothetical protein
MSMCVTNFSPLNRDTGSAVKLGLPLIKTVKRFGHTPCSDRLTDEKESALSSLYAQFKVVYVESHEHEPTAPWKVSREPSVCVCVCVCVFVCVCVCLPLLMHSTHNCFVVTEL